MSNAESARYVFLNGVAPSFDVPALTALRNGLAADDARMTQGRTVLPTPTDPGDPRPAACGCPVVYAAWKGEGVRGVGALDERFAAVCRNTERQTGVPHAAAEFLNWWDETPRAEARPVLLEWVELALAQATAETAVPDAPIPCPYF
jgi:hypothetical protein